LGSFSEWRSGSGHCGSSGILHFPVSALAKWERGNLGKVSRLSAANLAAPGGSYHGGLERAHIHP